MQAPEAGLGGLAVWRRTTHLFHLFCHVAVKTCVNSSPASDWLFVVNIIHCLRRLLATLLFPWESARLAPRRGFRTNQGSLLCLRRLSR